MRAVALPTVLGLVAIVGLAIVATMLVARHNGWAIGLDTQPSRRLLLAIEDQAGLGRAAAGPVSWTPVDGTTPDMATRAYRIAAAAPVRAAIVGACHAQRLAAPGSDDLRMMPDLACQGRWNGSDVTVELSVRCAAACQALLTVDAI